MRDLPLNALRAFALVYEHGGVRLAARELGIAHSSVSRHLAELEAWLGVRLTRKAGGRHGLTLTSQGETLGRAALDALREMARATAALREARSVHSVTISTTPSFASRWLLPRLFRLEEAHPRIELSIVVDQRRVDLATGDIDLAVRMGPGPWPDVRAEPLMDDTLYPVMSPRFWERSGRPRAPGDLVGLRLLHDRDPSASWEAWRQAHGPAALDVRAGPRFASSDLVLRAAIQGHGVALARHRLADDDVVAGALLRPLAGRSVEIGPAYWIVFSTHARVRAAARQVADWLKDEAARAGSPGSQPDGASSK